MIKLKQLLFEEDDIGAMVGLDVDLGLHQTPQQIAAELDRVKPDKLNVALKKTEDVLFNAQRFGAREVVAKATKLRAALKLALAGSNEAYRPPSAKTMAPKQQTAVTKHANKPVTPTPHPHYGK